MGCKPRHDTEPKQNAEAMCRHVMSEPLVSFERTFFIEFDEIFVNLYEGRKTQTPVQQILTNVWWGPVPVDGGRMKIRMTIAEIS